MECGPGQDGSVFKSLGLSLGFFVVYGIWHAHGRLNRPMRMPVGTNNEDDPGPYAATFIWSGKQSPLIKYPDRQLFRHFPG